jgi:hypothetical protein
VHGQHDPVLVRQWTVSDALVGLAELGLDLVRRAPRTIAIERTKKRVSLARMDN